MQWRGEGRRRSRDKEKGKRVGGGGLIKIEGKRMRELMKGGGGEGCEGKKRKWKEDKAEEEDKMD